MITPQAEVPEIARILGVPKLYIKREDLHPYGSHKGRSIPVMIDIKIAEGVTDFAISSSGNAALAALRHIQKNEHKLSLTIFIGENINPEKQKALTSEINDPRITIKKTERPLQTLTNFIKGKKVASLRQSTDDSALIGYKTLAEEITEIPNLEAVFIATSSGTTAQALAQYFSKPANERTRSVAVHVVQTTGVSPIAQTFAHVGEITGTVARTGGKDTEHSLADAIVDKVAHRREAVVATVTRTGGSGWIATNDDIATAQKLLKEKAGIDATPNGALGLAGLLEALKIRQKFTGAVVCIITGK